MDYSVAQNDNDLIEPSPWGSSSPRAPRTPFESSAPDSPTTPTRHGTSDSVSSLPGPALDTSHGSLGQSQVSEASLEGSTRNISERQGGQYGQTQQPVQPVKGQAARYHGQRGHPQPQPPATQQRIVPQYKLTARVTALERSGRKDPVLRFDVYVC